jgi:hypothetical protein
MLSRRQLQGFVGQRRWREARSNILSIDWIIDNFALAVFDFKPERERAGVADLPALDLGGGWNFHFLAASTTA